MLFLGVFSFTIGVVGLFGTKYLKPVLYMLVPLTVCNVIKVVLFWTTSEMIIIEGLMDFEVIRFFKIFGIVEIANKILSILLIARNVSSLRKLEEKKAHLETVKRSKVVKGVIDSRYNKKEEKIQNFMVEVHD
jgi:hypothetical protein